MDQQQLINQFILVKVLVSPHRRTINTAVNLLKTHPQFKNMTFVLYPMVKATVNNANDLPVSRQILLEYIEHLKTEHPGLNFDLSLINESKETENTWLIH